MVKKGGAGTEMVLYSQFRNFTDSSVWIITSYNYFLRNQIRKESANLQHFWFSLLSLDVETFLFFFFLIKNKFNYYVILQEKEIKIWWKK